MSSKFSEWPLAIKNRCKKKKNPINACLICLYLQNDGNNYHHRDGFGTTRSVKKVYLWGASEGRARPPRPHNANASSSSSPSPPSSSPSPPASPSPAAHIATPQQQQQQLQQQPPAQLQQQPAAPQAPCSFIYRAGVWSKRPVCRAPSPSGFSMFSNIFVLVLARSTTIKKKTVVVNKPSTM